MGTGGPSREEREAQERMRQLQAQQQAQQQQFITAANVPDPLEERLRARDMNWMDWEEGKSGPRDVMNAPLGAGLDLYSNAARRQQGERFGIGALALGAHGSDPNLAQLLKQQSEDTRQQEAAGGLEQAVRMKSAEVNRSALPLAEFAQNRRMGLASLASGNAANSTNAYLQFLLRPKQPSFWKQLLAGGMQAAASKAQMGCITLNTPILTPDGYRAIGDINEGDLVIGVARDGTESALPVVRKRIKPESDILRVNEMECSPSDRIMASSDDHTERFASELQVGDHVDGQTIESITLLVEKKPVAIVKLGSHTENFGFRDKWGFLHLDDYAVKGANT